MGRQSNTGATQERELVFHTFVDNQTFSNLISANGLSSNPCIPLLVLAEMFNFLIIIILPEIMNRDKLLGQRVDSILV